MCVHCQNANLLVCTGSTGRIFEITKSKEIVWDAIVRSKQTGEDTTWKDMPQYRSSWTAGLKRYYVLITCKNISSAYSWHLHIKVNAL